MKYRDVVQIPEPLEVVKQVRDSATEGKAKADVETFVISDRMASQLADTLLPNLRFDEPGDNRGLFIVGTYGTGKTHLMSVIAAIAEFPGLLAEVRNEAVRDSLTPVEGQFEVIRFDIGASTMSLRDIVCTELTNGLSKRGVDFEFPPIDKVTNTKDSLVEMMGAFEAKHPEKGLLFALDEMLDYLRGRKDAELIQDLAFLREVGEVCKNTRFRFIGGLQESLFDNPRFQGAADAIRRVKDRFQQIRIAREDVAFVVRERLLPKTVAQREQIKEHLTPYTPLFEGMVERLDDFVSLYPIHPSFLATFEQLTLVEKREVLRTIEGEIRRLADVEVPSEAPGVVCIDSYRARLADDPGARTVPEVQEVLDKSDVVRNKIQTALPKKQYVDTALRMVDALTVHRLTTDDVRARIGLTVEELRDQLFLLPPGLPKKDAVFLRTTIEAILNETLAAVSGQFLSRNEDNAQIYLDVDKDIDYDQLIEQRADSLDDDKLDAAYYTSMEEALGVRDDPYVSGYKIWKYSLPWPATNSDRTGYLFMGAPNQRSTAQPPRDFYIYFLQPFDLPKFIDEEKSDEVFLRLASLDDEFKKALRRYAGARELARESTADRKPVYEQKAQEAQRAMVAWLRSNMPTAMTVTYRGEKKSLEEWLHVAPGERSSVRDQIETVNAHILGDHFEKRFPGYPTFAVNVTPANLVDAVHSALVHLADVGKATTASRKILSSLELLGSEDGAIRADGKYAAHLAQQLADAGGKVLNRSDVLTERDPGLRTWGSWHLEPAWLAVVAASLTHLGKAEMVFGFGRVDALNLDKIVKLDLDDLEAFTHIAPPTALPTDALSAAAEILGLAPGVIPSTGANQIVVGEFGTRATALLEQVIEAEDLLTKGLDVWGYDVVDLVDERQARIKALRSFAEDLKARNSVGKLNKLSFPAEAVEKARAGKNELTRLLTLQRAAAKLAPALSYLREAVASFGEENPVSQDALDLRTQLDDILLAPEIDGGAVSAVLSKAENLKSLFVAAADAYYRHAFLDAAGDKRKQQLLASQEWADLGKLAAITLLQGGQFTSLKADLADIQTIMSLDDNMLRKSVVVDGRNPGQKAGPSADARLEQVATRCTELLDTWEETLRDNLSDAELDDQIALLDASKRQVVESIRTSGTIPRPVTDDVVSAVDQVFRRFEIRALPIGDAIKHLFPGDGAATPDELRERFDEYLGAITAGAPADRVRIVLHDEETE